MKQQQAPPPNNLPPHLIITNSTFNDWIEWSEVMTLLKVSDNTLRRYVELGILHFTPLIKRRLFYKPHILLYLETHYR